MRWKTTVALALLVTALGGVVLWDLYAITPRRERETAAKGRLWPDLEVKDVQAVTLTRKDERIRIERAGDDWELVEPIRSRADRGAVDGLVTAVVTARADREVAASPARPEEFGLDPPQAEVTLTVKGRDRPVVLQVGAKSPTGAWVFAREAGKPAVVAVGETIGRDAARPLADLRDRTVLAFDRGAVTGIDVEVAGERLALAPGEGGTWRLTAPRALAADVDVVNDFLEKLGGARAKEFVTDAPGPLGPYGLDRPATVTVWTGKDTARAARTLRLGKVDAARKGIYVQRAGAPGVLLADEALWAAVPKTVAAIRDKTVVAYAHDKLQKVHIESPRGQVTLAREGSTWTIASPEGVKPDTGAVSGLVWKIRDLKATGFLAEEPGAAARLLPRPEVTVRLWTEGTPEPTTLLLAPSREQRGGRPAALAAVAGRGPVMLVPGEALADLGKTADDLRDRTLFPAFDLGDVRRARLASGGRVTVVERKGSGAEWRVVEPARGPARDSAVTDVLLALKTLRWKDAVAEGPPERYGLDAPALEVTLYRADGAEIGTLLVGRQEGGVTYVRLRAAPTVYTVESRALGELRKAPGEVAG